MSEAKAEKNLKDKTVFITGASRGIGAAIGLRAAQDGANVVVIGKTKRPREKLPGTIYSSAEAIEKVGGKALPIACDIREEEDIQRAVALALKQFGGIDILVNNASALYLASTSDIPMKRYDLVQEVNTRGTFACTQACVPHLKEAANPHVLMIAPPLNLEARWFAPHLAYSISKYGMSLCVLGMAAEFKPLGIGVNSLWPRTTIATVAIQNVVGGEAMMKRSRKPEIMGDAARAILTRSSQDCTGNFFVDEDVLRSEGVADLESYSVEPGSELQPDFFL